MFSIFAAEEVQAGLGRLSEGKEVHLRVWSAIQSLLVAVANISKILWSGSAKRGKDLRTILEISDGSELHQRALRNHFEHYDERLVIDKRLPGS